MPTYLNQQQLLDLLQVTNSNFPIGSFSHSFGIETYIRKNLITNIEELDKWIKVYLYDNFSVMDLLAIRQCYVDYQNKDWDHIYKMDQIISVSGMSKETRNGTIRIATQMMKLYLDLFADVDVLKKYQEQIKIKQCHGHPAIAFSLLCCHLNIDYQDCLYAYTYSSIANLIQNCIRAIPLGQVEGQKLIYHVKQSFSDVFKRLETLDFDKNFCKNFPGFEIKQMDHENIHVRLFMS